MKKNSNNYVVTFLYHEVTDTPNSSGFNIKSNLPYKLKTKEFINHMNIIENCSIKPTTIDKFDNNSTNHQILLTFDDGGKSAMYIADILDKNNWKGHFLITTSMIGNLNFLNKLDIKELFERKHIIGTHSHNHHAPFRNLNFNEMLYEWSHSIKILEQIISSKIICASIPGGDMDEKTVISAKNCKIKFLFTSEPQNKLILKDEITLVGRVCPKVGTKISKIKNFANNKGFVNERLARFAKNFIRTILGPFYTYYVKKKHSY